MKIAVCGKGGSGKSTVVTLLANEMRERHHYPLVVDSDESNSGLYHMLGLAQPPIPLVELVGGKKMVKQRLAPKYSPGVSESETNVLDWDEITLDDIPAPYIQERDGVKLVSTGKIIEALEGCACPIGILSREFLSKLRLKDNESVIVDMEAGVEHFGRGVETSVDRVLVAVEPSLESINLAEKVKHLSGGVGIDQVWAVLTKVDSDRLSAKLTEELAKREVAIIGAIPFDAEIYEACLDGRPLGKGKAAEEAGEILDILLSHKK